MQLFLRIDQNIASIVLLGCVFLIALGRLDRRDRLNRIFFGLSAVILAQLLIETLTVVLNRRPEPWAPVLSNLLHVCLFGLSPVISSFSFYLIRDLTEPDRVSRRTARLLFFIPIGANAVLTALSPAWGLVFVIGPGNVYARGPFFPASVVITYLYILCGFILVLRKRKALLNQEFVPLLIFCLLPLAGGVAQALFYGTLYIWSSSAYALVIAYIFLQQRMVQMDPLTGVWTRSSFGYYIAKRLRRKNPEKFGMIYLDMDGLKRINDEHGHNEGDNAIKNVIAIISGVIRENDIVARMGGDEFVVIMDCQSTEALKLIVDRLEAAFADFNERSDKGYRVECSFGADIFESGETGIEDFIHHVDNLMYQNKKRKREDRWNLSI